WHGTTRSSRPRAPCPRPWRRPCRGKPGRALPWPFACLLPQPLRHWQAGVVGGSELALGLDAEALEHGDHLARVLRRVPGATLEQLVQRALAVIRLHRLAAGFVRQLRPPAVDTLGDAGTVGGDMFWFGDFFRRWSVIDGSQVFHAVLHR